ncbi:zinc-binding alcohol dehydrogenase family protein [Kitasatospora sp. NPDC090091]|uniref:quinone oxidoreductase family protein n=1 Tax=Kitasatospora sp. NPDC090091 TaxID=3364081 RepID=UPI0038274452
MKAVVLGTDDRFRLTATADEPLPGPGEVAVRVAYAGVQWGDVLVRDGHFPVPRPFVPGFEAAGRIVAVGDGVDGGRIGEQVLALVTGGAYAEVVLAPAALAVPAPDVDARTAAGFGWTAPTAHDLIHTVTRLGPGESVLIHAASGAVGTLAAQFAAAAGARRIVGVAGSAGRADYARRFGFHEVLTRDRFPEALGDETFDVILDPVGGATRSANLALLAPHGRLAVYGNIASFAPVAVSANDLLMNGQSLLTYNSSLLSRTDPARLAAGAARALALVADGSVLIDITAEHGLADVESAIADLASGATAGKSIVRVQ